MIPDIEAFEERSAICQHDGGLSKQDAEDLSAREQGYSSALAYWQWLSRYVAERAVPSGPPSSSVKPGAVVILRPIDDIPQHLFRVVEVFDDLVTGYSLTGPLKDEYGEPYLDLILRVLKDDGT